MINVTCDICGKVAASSHQVDRYQFRIDLCEAHLLAWIHELLENLPEYRNSTQVDHNLSRALIDAVVMGYQGPTAPPANPGEAPRQPPVGLGGQQELHRLANHFIKINKSI